MSEKVNPILTIPRGSGAVQINTKASFEGKDYVDVRFMYKDKASGELKPTRKGVMLSHTEFKKLANFFTELSDDPVQNKRLRKLRLKEKENANRND